MGEHRKMIYDCESVTGLTTLGNDTTNLITCSTNFVRGAASIEFAKVDGAAGSTIAGVYATLPELIDLDTPARYGPSAKIKWLVYISDITNVAYSFVRIGSSSTNYLEWRFADSSHTAARWTVASANLGDCYTGGTGADMGALGYYLAFGVAFDGESNALANLRFDGIWVDNELV